MKYYLVYSASISQQPDSAHEIHDVMCADAVANLDYPSLLVYPDYTHVYKNYLSPFKPQAPDDDFVKFYNVQNKLQVVPLPIPKILSHINIRGINSGSFIYKYYFPFHILPHTKIIHTRSWNCVKIAVKHKVPVIYEKHYFQEEPFESEIVNSPFFKIAITQSEPTKESLIKYGMPEDKAVWMHNGFNQAFLARQPEEAENWRKELLKDGRKHLVIYSGALYSFKGIDVLIDTAKLLPQIQFALTGGTDEQLQAYRQLVKEKQVENINFLGWILPLDRLVSLLQAADVLAHPHCSGKSANFTNPLKFFQYIASGTPIVATEIPPLLMFKSAPIAALWCPPDNPNILAQCIEQTLQTYPRKVEGYAENIEFSRQFSCEERAKKILELSV